MEQFTKVLDENAENVLRTVIGRASVGFYFPEAWLNINREGASISSASISVSDKGYVIIENSWSDTAKDYLDIFYLEVSIADKPKDIPVTRDPNGPTGWGFERVSTIHTWAPTIVNKIGIYEYSLSGEHESVTCDRAILFEYEKGQILISAGGTTFDQLEINYKPHAIEAILSPLKMRKVLT